MSELNYRRDQIKYRSLAFPTDRQGRLRLLMVYLERQFHHMPTFFDLSLDSRHRNGTKQKWQNPLSKVVVKRVPHERERVRFVWFYKKF